jgi:hypothetical protein
MIAGHHEARILVQRQSDFGDYGLPNETASTAALGMSRRHVARAARIELPAWRGLVSKGRHRHCGISDGSSREDQRVDSEEHLRVVVNNASEPEFEQ